MTYRPVELVELPDPAIRPLVHPLDVPAARRQLLAAATVSALTGPFSGAAVAALTWFASRSWWVPLLVAPLVIGCGELARRQFEEQAWAHVPRRRADRARGLPLSWQVGQALAAVSLWGLLAMLVAGRLAQPDVAGPVAEVTFGMAAATGLLVVADLFRPLLSRGRTAAQAALPVVSVLGLLVALGGVNQILHGTATAPPTPQMVHGAGAMLLVGAVVGACGTRGRIVRTSSRT